MNIDAINHLISLGHINLDIEAGITLKIKDEFFRPGTVRVHLPAPINASWLKEGQLLDSEPMFRMVSNENYPQRSVYYNERLKENIPFSVKYAFTSEHTYIKPDINLIDATKQKSFSREDVEHFKKSHHCGCESYTSLSKETVSILDVIEDRGIEYKNEYREYLDTLSLFDNIKVKNKYGSAAYKIFRYIIENFYRANRSDHNIAFVSMCRMCGIPARWQGGWADNRGHDWAMVHLLPYGWIYVDCLFGADAYHSNILEQLPFSGNSSNEDYENNASEDFFFGNIDPCMVPTASVPGADLYPAKDYERTDKKFNVYGEVELVPDKLSADGNYIGYPLTANEYESIISIQSV